MEKKYEIELTWICEKSNFTHQIVPDNLIREAERKAVAAIEEEQMG
jgi:20S proteasome subunit alpha 7